MMECPKCASEIADTQRYCGSCGTPVDPASIATRTSVEGTLPPSPTGSSARFLPGAMIAGRYRINGLLGRGGMGEVYRADDLKLQQPVALKFLPAEVSNNPDRLQRFLGEVKIARQVSHPNVCRVYDVGEFEGQHFLSMEHVDGEDLSTLLRRVGHVPHDRAVQMARELCAGLSAAHGLGVLHRDVKPANVMLDGRGRVKLTDFGLAGLIGEFEGAEVRAGTPAYMAPEQLSGAAVTVRSDVYSLGLVLYELFTGRTPFGTDRPSGAPPQLQSTPSVPSSFMQDFNPQVERAIMACLEKDPELRPVSALSVSAALPGGDALAEALAAGETPSPEMVAAAGGTGALRPGVALACLLFSLACLIPIVALHERFGLVQLVDLPHSSAVMAQKSREVLEDVGYKQGADRAYGFQRRADVVQRIVSSNPSEKFAAFTGTRPAAVGFWYRESPKGLMPDRPGPSGWFVREDNPVPRLPGMTGVSLDPDGRLVSLYAVPPVWETIDPSASAVDWSVLFDHAQIDTTSLRPLTPSAHDRVTRNPVAWEGFALDRPDIKLRIEAGSMNGRPLQFSVTPADVVQAQLSQVPPAAVALGWPFALIVVVLVTSSVLMARHNIRAGRGDRRGAARISIALMVCYMMWWLLHAHFTTDPAWLLVLAWNIGWTLFSGATTWVVYVALEPHVRRLWPEVLVSWARLLAGRFRDPRVGRDVLIGAVFYGSLTVWQVAIKGLRIKLGLPMDFPVGMNLDGLLGARQAAGQYFGELTVALIVPLFLMSLLVLIRLLLKNEYVTIAAAVTVLTLVAMSTQGNMLGVIGMIGTGLAMSVCLTRFGLLAMASMMALSTLDQAFILTLDMNAWYVGQSIVALLIFLGILGLAYRTSLGERGASPGPVAG